MDCFVATKYARYLASQNLPCSGGLIILKLDVQHQSGLHPAYLYGKRRKYSTSLGVYEDGYKI